MRTTTTYDRVTIKVSQRGECPVCGKPVRRQETLGQTINPFNRNSDGSPRTAQDIRTALIAESAQWKPDFTHDSCR
jgi:hypothetical protein